MNDILREGRERGGALPAPKNSMKFIGVFCSPLQRALFRNCLRMWVPLEATQYDVLNIVTLYVVLLILIVNYFAVLQRRCAFPAMLFPHI